MVEQVGMLISDEHRVLAEISAWDLHIFTGRSSENTPIEFRFQGGLLFSRSIEISARIVAPASLRGRDLRVWISILSPDVRFDERPIPIGQWEEVGAENRIDVTVRLPEVAFTDAVTALSTIWRYVHLWWRPARNGEGHITAFSFDRRLHANVEAWLATEQ
jgi:hypothetical protein